MTLLSGFIPIRDPASGCSYRSSLQSEESAQNRALHLINYTGSINENSVYKVAWVAPLVDIAICLRKAPGKKLTSAKLLSTGEALPWREDDHSLYCKISVLDGYECVLFTSE